MLDDLCGPRVITGVLNMERSRRELEQWRLGDNDLAAIVGRWRNGPRSAGASRTRKGQETGSPKNPQKEPPHPSTLDLCWESDLQTC